jgi:RNA polymerase sigma-70 factor (ECF subfamily)
MDLAYDPSQLLRSSDEELVLRLQAGQHDALSVLFQRFHRLVLAVAIRIVRDPAEAEDVAQEVFLAIYHAAAQFNPNRAKAKVWVLQFAYGHSFSRRRRLVARSFYSQEEIRVFDERLATEVTWGAFNPPEAKRLIEEALQSLTSKERRTVKMAYFEGFSLAEIAERTDESHVAIRHQYYRGLNRLRLLLSASGQKEELSAVRQEVPDVGA